jgi:hypothetical protein
MMTDIKQIIRENELALENVGGPIGFYFRDPLAKALLVFYRLHYDTSAEKLVALIAEGTNYDMTEGDDISEIIIEFVSALFPEMPKLAIFTGEPVVGQTYLALCELSPQLFNFTKEWTDAAGNQMKATHVADMNAATMSTVGLYSLEYGFRFLGDKLSSADIDSVVSYTLMYQPEEV